MPYRARTTGRVLDIVPPSLIGVIYDEIPVEAPVVRVSPPEPSSLPLETPPKRPRGRPRKVRLTEEPSE
jgi:hypothetical protein